MSEVNEQFRKALKKEAEKSAFTMPAMSDLLSEKALNQHETDFYENIYHVSREYEFNLNGTSRIHQMQRDASLRRQADRIHSAGALQEDLDFRRKQECYQEKTDKQEEEALKRSNGRYPDLTGIDLVQLSGQKQQLEGAIRTGAGTDVLMQGENAFNKEYLSVIDDLITTIRKEQKSPSEKTKKHLVLAVEKYRFYSVPENRLRLIGKAQAEAFAKTGEYKNEMRQKASVEIPDELINLLSKESITDSSGKETEDGKIIKKAYADQRHYLLEIRKRQDRIALLEARASQAQNKEARKPLKSYIETLEKDITLLRYYANGAEQCVRYLLMKKEDRASYAGSLSDFAGLFKKQYGVDIKGFDSTKKLREQPMAARIGVVNGTIGTVFSEMPGLSREERERLQTMTGYEIQEEFEKRDEKTREARENGARALDSVISEHPEQDALLKEPLFTDLALLYHRLPNGVLPDNHQVVKMQYDPDYDIVTEGEMKRHLENLRIISDMEAGKAAVKQAIESEMTSIDRAYDDITRFMTVNTTRQLFEARNQENLFLDTGGLPSFRNKARELRTVISAVLSCTDAMREIGKDTYEELSGKWQFLNKAVAFVEQREKLMNEAYHMTPWEFANRASAFSMAKFDENGPMAVVSWQEIPKEEFDREQARSTIGPVLKNQIAAELNKRAEKKAEEEEQRRLEEQQRQAQEKQRKKEEEEALEAEAVNARKVAFENRQTELKLTPRERRCLLSVESYEARTWNRRTEDSAAEIISTKEEQRDKLRRDLIRGGMTPDLQAQIKMEKGKLDRAALILGNNAREKTVLSNEVRPLEDQLVQAANEEKSRKNKHRIEALNQQIKEKRDRIKALEEADGLLQSEIKSAQRNIAGLEEDVRRAEDRAIQLSRQLSEVLSEPKQSQLSQFMGAPHGTRKRPPIAPSPQKKKGTGMSLSDFLRPAGSS